MVGGDKISCRPDGDKNIRADRFIVCDHRLNTFRLLGCVGQIVDQQNKDNCGNAIFEPRVAYNWSRDGGCVIRG